MPNTTFIQKIKSIFTPDTQLKSLLNELVVLQEDMRVSLGHIDKSQKDIINALKEVENCISDIKRHHSYKGSK